MNDFLKDLGLFIVLVSLVFLWAFDWMGIKSYIKDLLISPEPSTVGHQP